MEAVGLTVWAGISFQSIIGPHFFDSTMTGESYLKMLNDYFYSVFNNLSGNELHNSFFIQESIFCDSLYNDLIFYARWCTSTLCL